MTFAQRRNRLTTHFSERITVVKRRISVITRYFYAAVCIGTAYWHIYWRLQITRILSIQNSGKTDLRGVYCSSIFVMWNNFYQQTLFF